MTAQAASSSNATMVATVVEADACRTDGSHRLAFLIEAAPDDEPLLRILGLIAVRGGSVRGLSASETAQRMTIRIEIDGIEDGRAESAAERLRGMPGIYSVGLMWRPAAYSPG